MRLYLDLMLIPTDFLFAKTDEESEAYLVIEVTVRVLKIGPWNMSLIGS